ncbi:riboflavin synthase [bacterium]|nr:riboflavin synthase [bacterium]
MFTGIIEEVGEVRARTATEDGARLVVAARRVLADATPGASIAVSGVCLTLIEFDSATFTCDLSRETLSASTLGRLERGARVNLERALSAGGRLSGHLVQGHVDGIGTVRRIEKTGHGAMITLVAPADLRRYIARKGSIAVDGISLTVAELGEDGFSIAVIPATWDATNVSDWREGTEVNLETDMLARYLERLLSASKEKASELSLETLAEEGFL